MIGPGPPTQFIPYVLYGVYDAKARRWRYFEQGIFTRCVRPCIAMQENARSVILHEMIDGRLYMNPVNVEQ